MYLKQYFNDKTKTILVLFTVISLLLHLIFIFFSSNLSSMIKSPIDLNDYVSNKSDYAFEVEFRTDEKEDEKPEVEEELEERKEKEEDKKEDLPDKIKRQLFVDTSDQDVDEEPEVETDKIGEKGSIARDMYEGDDNINDGARITSDLDLLEKTQDELVVANNMANNMQEQLLVAPAEMIISEQPQNEIFEKVPEAPDVGPPDERHTTKTPEEDFLKEDPHEETSENNNVKENQPLVEEKVEELYNSDSGLVSLIEEVDATLEILDGPDKDAKLDELKKDIMSLLEKEEVEQKDKEIEDLEERIEKTVEIEKSEIKEELAFMDKEKDIVEDDYRNIPDEIKNVIAPPVSQVYNAPVVNDAPFFEDNISNSPIRGKESFNVKKNEYAHYYKHIRERITTYWFVQYGTDASINLVTNNYDPVIVKFRVIPSGEIVKVVVTDTAGNDLLASKIQTSIQNTRVNKFPDYVKEEHINVRFNFYFF